MDFLKIILITIFIGLLTGCGMSVEEEIYNHLEKAVSLEADFEKQQQPLVELETNEQNLYEKIIKLRMSEFKEIQALSQQASAIVDKRETRIDKENESIEAAKQEFLLIEPKVEKLKDQKTKAKAEKLIATMNKRFESYTNLYNYYKDAIKLDRELYKMLQKEELTYQQLEEQIKKINGIYDNVVKENQKFNDLTDTYNKYKKEFYLASDLNVVLEKETDKVTIK